MDNDQLEKLIMRFLPGPNGDGQPFYDAVVEDARCAKMSAAYRCYYRLRPFIPVKLRRMLQRQLEHAATDEWYIPRRLLLLLAQSFGPQTENPSLLHPWPHGADFAFVLTHDVEEAEGLRNIPKVAELEQQLGFRSSWNIVPHRYPIDFGLLRDLQARGFEIGVHGYNHDGKLFLTRRHFESRLPSIHRALEEFGAVGFRAPMVHRNLQWMQELEIQYDASCFDVDPFQAMPGGVQQLWPFVAGRFIELPYTLPQDHTLFFPCGASDDRIWRDKLAMIRRLHGMALMITHPDYLASPRELEIYRRFLLHVQELSGFWHALPRDVALWWRRRDESQAVWKQSSWQVVGPAADEAIIVRPRLDGDSLDLTRIETALANATRPESSLR